MWRWGSFSVFISLWFCSKKKGSIVIYQAVTSLWWVISQYQWCTRWRYALCTLHYDSYLIFEDRNIFLELELGYEHLIDMTDRVISFFYCQAISFSRMFSIMWQKNNKMKQKEVILLDKGNCKTCLIVIQQNYGQASNMRLKDICLKQENFVCDLIISGRLLKVIATLTNARCSIIVDQKWT